MGEGHLTLADMRQKIQDVDRTFPGSKHRDFRRIYKRLLKDFSEQFEDRIKANSAKQLEDAEALLKKRVETPDSSEATQNKLPEFAPLPSEEEVFKSQGLVG